ncbi:hypothetical protein AB0B45_00990 [Nonomuraea sp. NPDC049152]|uniref:hypothetical protein n=1 Tax=Nonomuraea sp. NPDC049152 TaxID=3154350 RepID=UPI0033E247A0
MTRTEQEIRRGAPVGGGVPRTAPAKTGVRRQSPPRETSPATGRPAVDRPIGQRPASAQESGQARARVRRPMPRKQRAPFVLLVVGLLCGGLVSLLLLNTVLARDSFTAGELREQIAEMQLQSDAIQQEINKREQPGELASDAEKQGLTDDGSTNTIDPSKAGRDR